MFPCPSPGPVCFLGTLCLGLPGIGLAAAGAALGALLLLLFARKGRHRTLARDLETQMAARTAALQESEARLQGFIRHAPAAIFCKDLNGHLVLVNRRGEALLGRGGDPDRNFEARFPPERRAKWREQDQRVLTLREELQAEEALELPDGETRTFLVQKFPLLDSTGGCWGLGVIATDVTESRQDELAQRQRQQLEALGLLAGGIAHDFNNLLGAMQGNLELAKVDLGQDLEAPPQAGQHLQILEELIQRATTLVAQILAYAGKGRCQVQTLDLNGQLMAMTRILRASISGRISLRCDLDPALRTVAAANLRRLGFTTVEARDGLEALQVFEANREGIVLVLMDLTMPRMGGEEAYRHLRGAGAMVPIILSSGFGLEEALRHFRGKGLAGFLPKPYALRTLETTVQTALAGSQPWSGTGGPMGREPVPWLPECETGHPLIDAQHQGMVRAYNRVVAATDPEELTRALACLIDVTLVHFGVEEGLMAAAGYPDLREHQRVHARLTRQIQDLAAQIGRGETPLSPALLDFMEDWTLCHIQMEDMELARRLKAAGQ